MTLLTIAASLFLLQNATGSIEGTVLNTVTNQPIVGAQVNATRLSTPPVGLIPGVGATARAGIAGGVLSGTVGGASTIVSGSPSARQPQIQAAPTDQSGHFAIPNLEPGMYLLRATANGYVPQDSGRLSSAGQGGAGQGGAGQGGMIAPINVMAGQMTAGSVLRLTPTGTVSGRITAPNGEPLVNIEVSLLRSMYDEFGRRTMSQAAAPAQTNDRGEYRLFWVPPGRYYLSAAGSNRPMPGVPFNAGTASPKYARMFYPGTTEPGAASPIDIQPTADLNSMDFRFSEHPTYRIRGRLNVSGTGQESARGVSISITPRNSIVNIGGSSSGAAYNPADNTFELRDIPSGSYLIRAQLPLTTRPEPGQPMPIPPIATAAVDVVGSDIDGVVLSFLPPVSIVGRVRIEGESATVQVPRINLSFRPLMPANPIRPPQWNADGTFVLNGVLPGDYVVTVNGTGSPQTYVKEMRYGSVDILSQPMTVGGPVSDEITIVLARNGGQISGIVRGDAQQPLPNSLVTLIPNQRDRRDLYQLATTDSGGRFTFRAVSPGSYKVFAWQEIERNSWLGPAFLRAYETSGTAASVSDSSNVTLNLQIIPHAAR